MRKKIQDEFTDLPVSRQRKHQLRKARDGKCLFCNEPALMEFFCLKHLKRYRERTRKQLGAKRRYRNALCYRLAAALAEPAKNPTDYLPAGFSLTLCKEDGSCHKLEFKSKRLIYRSGSSGEFDSEPRVVTVPALRWQVFWGAVDAAQVWDWQRHCNGKPGDDLQWKLTLRHKDRKVSSAGKNAFPGPATTSPVLMRKFLLAVRQLTKLREFRI